MKLYHATKEDNVTSILDKGLLLEKNTGGVIFFVETIDAARAWKKGEVILEVEFADDEVVLWDTHRLGTIKPSIIKPGPPWQFEHPDGRLSPVHQQNLAGVESHKTKTLLDYFPVSRRVRVVTSSLVFGLIVRYCHY